MKKFLHKLGQRNAHTDIVFFCIMWIAYVPVWLIVYLGVAPAIIFLLFTCTMIVLDVECGNSALTLTP
jgi:hypothetical protein